MRSNLCLTAALVLSCGVAFACQPTPETKRLERDVVAHYQAGQPGKAAKAMKARSYAAPWVDHGQVEVQAVFHSRAKGLTLNVRRKAGVSSSGDMFVAFPPGTWAKPLTRSGDCPQDLILLRAPVVALGSLHRTGSVTVPVACASFRRQGPKGGVGYTLQMAAPTSNLGRLARVLCMGSATPPDPELALAVWIAHEDLGYQRIAQSAGFRTFRTPRQKVVPLRDAVGAERLLRRAGIAPQSTPFFRELNAVRGRGKPQTKAPAKGPASKAAPKPKRTPAAPRTTS